jgi:hypothetical protein
MRGVCGSDNPPPPIRDAQQMKPGSQAHWRGTVLNHASCTEAEVHIYIYIYPGVDPAIPRESKSTAETEGVTTWSRSDSNSPVQRENLIQTLVFTEGISIYIDYKD